MRPLTAAAFARTRVPSPSARVLANAATVVLFALAAHLPAPAPGEEPGEFERTAVSARPEGRRVQGQGHAGAAGQGGVRLDVRPGRGRLLAARRGPAPDDRRPWRDDDPHPPGSATKRGEEQ